MPLPNFIIIGTSRAGTTSLYYYLKQHPQIYMSPVKEPGFFVFEGRKEMLTPVGRRKLPRFAWDWDAYRSLFDGVRHEKAIGEATSGCLYHPWVPEKIHSRLPDVKMIAVLRNPIDRAYSLYLLHVRDGLETATSFAESLALEEERISQGMFYCHYKKGGLYAEQLQRYFKYFPREQFRIFLYEDLKNDPLRVVQEIFQFLEVDPSFVPDMSAKFNPSVGSQKGKLMWKIVNTILKQEPVKKMLPQTVQHRIAGKLYEWKMKGYHPQPKPPLDPEIRKELMDYYRNDILQLQDLIGRDLSHWLGESVSATIADKSY